MTSAEMLEVAINEAIISRREGGIPIGAALFSDSGKLLGSGHNRRVQDNDPAIHAETDAFKKAGRIRDYRSTIMVTTLSPCWYCSGLVIQFGIGQVIIGENANYLGGESWLLERGVLVNVMNNRQCEAMLKEYIENNPDVWNEDIGK